MARWEPGSRGRLEEAALELFSEHGFEGTTVADIAARAGVTERTFFRHYADKREVLFAGQAILHEVLVGTVVAAPADVTPMDAVLAAVEAAGEVLADRRAIGRHRQAIVAATPELRERELIKMASLGAAMAEALVDRGVDPAIAAITAQLGITVFGAAFTQWIAADDADADFTTLVRSSYATVQAATSA